MLKAICASVGYSIALPFHHSKALNVSCIHHIHDETLILATINSEQYITSIYPEPLGMSDPEYDKGFGNEQIFGMIQCT